MSNKFVGCAAKSCPRHYLVQDLSKICGEEAGGQNDDGLCHDDFVLARGAESWWCCSDSDSGLFSTPPVDSNSDSDSDSDSAPLVLTMTFFAHPHVPKQVG